MFFLKRYQCSFVLMLLMMTVGILPAVASEETLGSPTWSLNGFGTLGFSHSSEKSADFVFDNVQPKGTGYSRDWNPDIDTRLGVQVTANLNSEWSAVLQVLSEYRWDNSYTPFVNWANIRYAVSPDLSIRFGRIALASYMASSSRKVGYSNPWIRPSAEVYRLLVLTNSDGVDLSYRQHFQDVTNNLTLLYGKKTVINTRGAHIHSSDVWGVFDTLEYGPSSLHFAYQERHVDNQSPPLGRFISVSASYDPGQWLMNVEAVNVVNYDGKGVKAIRAAWNISAAYRLGRWTPFVSLSELRPLSETGVAPIAQKTISAGVRWDLMRNLDFKLQADHIRIGQGSAGTLQNLQPDFQRGGRVNVLTAAFDFVF